ncbi:unnamed protein product [Zymoseptoria tritici ST99CH_3D7]|uniref:Uncharacterized protein n=2 Tax=Zymoseptoria tritici TaxID=1047171 RepID=A0A1X7SAG6_ZYMT9|nr:unnamed protein product [Zymoseptoria tritici ST99CH_3D7]
MYKRKDEKQAATPSNIELEAERMVVKAELHSFVKAEEDCKETRKTEEAFKKGMEGFKKEEEGYKKKPKRKTWEIKKAIDKGTAQSNRKMEKLF